MKKNQFIPFIVCLSAPILHAMHLSDALTLALTHDLVHLQSKAQWSTEELNDKIAMSALLPQVEASYSKTKYHVDGTTSLDYERKQEGLSLSQMLFDAEKIARYTQANINKSIDFFTYQLHEQEFILHTASVYFNVLEHKDILQHAKAANEEYTYRYKQALEQEKQGLITHTEALQVLAQLAHSDASVIAAEHNLHNSIEVFKNTTGVIPKSLQALPPQDVYHHTLTPLEEYIHAADKKNLQYQIAKKQIEIMKTAQKASLGSYLPSIQANLVFNRTKNSPYNTQGTGKSNQRALSLTASVPITSGGKRTLQVYKSYRTLDKAHIDARKTLQDIHTEIRLTYRGLTASNKYIQAEKKAINADQQLLQMNRLRHDVGAITLVEILDSIARLRQNQQALAKARYDYILSTLKLKALTGTLGAKDIDAISESLTHEAIIE